MTNFLSNNPSLYALEKQMKQPPGYRPRGHGFCLSGIDWKGRGNYAEIVDCVISRMRLEQLNERITEIYFAENDVKIFNDEGHRRIFETMLMMKYKGILFECPNYSAAVFLLTADEKLWNIVRENVMDTGIYFDRVKLGRVTLEEYILFHAAKDVYYGTKHIRLSELVDRELIPDEILKLIVNALVIEKCGVEIVKREV